MFKQIWKKYLPVITILVKRSVKEEQSLSMNHTDFERAAGGRKVKFSFPPFVLIKGRVDYHTKLTPLGNDLVMLLQEDELTRSLVQKMQLEFSMTNNFQLLIKNHTPLSEPDSYSEESTESTEVG